MTTISVHTPVVPVEIPLQDTRDFPQISHEEMATLIHSIKWVHKPGKNDQNFETKHLGFTLQDKSIGVHFGNCAPLQENVTDEQIKASHPECKLPARKMLRTFRNDYNIGDTILIGQGRDKCLYVAEISSTYYFHPMEDEDICHHRRRICNIRRVPDGFCRRPLIQTLSAYEPL